MLTKEHNKLIENNINLVHFIARKLFSKFASRYTYDEMVSFGIEGLMFAAQRFDSSKGTQFSTYAFIRIHGQILHRVRDDKFYPYVGNRQDRLTGIERLFSLNSIVLSDEKERTEYIDKFNDEKSEKDILNNLLVHEAISLLPEDLRQIIELRYLQGLSQPKISKLIGFSQIKVSRLERKAIKMIRDKWQISA